MAWLSGWSYAKEISLTGQTGAGTLYQVDLDIGASAGGDFHLEGHCTNFPQDIEVTDDDGTTLLNFWIEDITADPIKMYVEVADDLGSNQKIWVYYGKSGATTNSDGDATFLNYDGFEDGSTTDAGDIWVFGANYASSAQAHSGTYSFDVMPGPGGYSQSLGSYALGSAAVGMWMYNSGTSGRQLTWVLLDSGGDRETDSAQYLKFEDAKTYAYHSGAWNDLSLPFTTGWNFVEIVVGTTTSDVSVNGNTASGVTNRNTVSNVDKIFTESTSQTNYIDDNYVRKYNSPEPAYASAGAEQSAPIVGNPYWYYNMLKRRN